MGFRIPRKSSDEVRSAGKYHYICTYELRAAELPGSYIHTDVVSATQPCSDHVFIMSFYSFMKYQTL